MPIGWPPNRSPAPSMNKKAGCREIPGTANRPSASVTAEVRFGPSPDWDTGGTNDGTSRCVDHPAAHRPEGHDRGEGDVGEAIRASRRNPFTPETDTPFGLDVGLVVEVGPEHARGPEPAIGAGQDRIPPFAVDVHEPAFDEGRRGRPASSS